MGTRIRGGWVVDPANGIDEQLDIYVEDGLIVGLGPGPANFEVEREYHVDGNVVCPGLIELRASLREPGQEHKATIASESRAAVRGGITTLCCTPDTDPVIDTPAVVELIHQRAAAVACARVEVQGALTQRLEGSRLSEMGALRDAGCIGVSNAYRVMENTEVVRRAMEYAATFGLTVLLFPEDPWLAQDHAAHEGAVGTRLGLPGLAETAETITLARDLLLVEASGVRAHICGLSTARGVEMVAQARARGLPVTADVALPNLFLTEMDVTDFNSACRVRPPLRTQRDREALRQGVREGTIATLCSAHQPHEPDAKQAPFTEAAPGISGLETLLVLTLRLVDEGLLTLQQAISRVTYEPARVFGLEAGTLSPGRPADICVFDPERHWMLTRERLWSEGRNTPFIGWEFKGEVTHTFVGGRLVYHLEEA